MATRSTLRTFFGIGQGTGTGTGKPAAGDPPPPAENPDQVDGNDPETDPNNANDPDNQTARQQLRQNMQNVIDADAADEAEADGDTDMAAARTRERARCARIFGSAAAVGRQDLAGHLAFNTTMGAGRAIAMMQAAPAGASTGGLDAAMAGLGAQRPGPAPAPKAAAKKVEEGWDAAFTAAKSRTAGK
jgi:hypothetical protein